MASNTEVQNLALAAVEGCLAMQAEHLAALKKGCLNKINQWLEDRQAMVAHLQQTLARVQPSEVDPDLRALLLDRISRILDREQTIHLIAEQQRDQVQDQLTAIRRGKKALHGYGPSQSTRRPQFVRDKG